MKGDAYYEQTQRGAGKVTACFAFPPLLIQQATMNANGGNYVI